MPDDYPNQPTNAQVQFLLTQRFTSFQILEYFKSYAEHFSLYKYITFNASVAEISQLKPSEGTKIFWTNLTM